MDPKWNEPAVGFGRHRIFRVGWALHGCLREMESHARGERRCGGYQVAQDQIVLGQEYTRAFQIATRCSPNCNIKRSCFCSTFLISIAL